MSCHDPRLIVNDEWEEVEVGTYDMGENTDLEVWSEASLSEFSFSGLTHISHFVRIMLEGSELFRGDHRHDY